ncbi:hypothetical protein [Algibacillus agarilyticus]|uniref:hypothetical protein n=1 Tax=Algibacillus agarilyticus TaxID=2234133 RepID=UPI000DCFB56A|nr:hypothetical protein [Algibacillus agarilyticus]
MKLFLLSYFIILCQLSAKPIFIPENANSRSLPVVLLNQVLVKQYGYQLSTPYKSEQYPVATSRVRNDLESGDIDIMWELSNKELEQRFKAIYIPVYRGLMGWRVALVKKQRIDLFSNVKNLADLRQFKAGQGTYWADTAVLSANGLTVVKELKYKNLFPMLDGERFDYFPRGIHEPWSELEREKSYGLVVEPNILFHYIAPMYFFVRDKDLHKEIKQGLLETIKNGKYLSYLYQDEQVAKALKNINFAQRKLLQLQNPYVTSTTQVLDNQLWFSYEELSKASSFSQAN